MRIFIIVICVFFQSLTSMAKVPALEREVNLTVTNEKVISVLTKIQEQTGLIFSYQPSLLADLQPVSMQIRQKTVREALALLFPKNISYKAKNNYIILKEKPAEINQKKNEISGYVYDKNTEKKLAHVSLYDKKSLQSVTSDEYGYYTITLPKEESCLSVNKENYRDTCVAVQKDSLSNLANIRINPLTGPELLLDSLYWRNKLKDFSASTNLLFKQFKGYVNTINIRDTISRPFQLSFVPFIGTNGLLSGNIYNDVSINVFGGYSRGTNGLEMGGFFNANRENMKGIQMAGFFNLVGDSVKGLQMAGFFNVVGKHVEGLQSAGFANVNVGTMEGIQLSGFVNANRKYVSGIQAAGFVNANAGGMSGISMAGFVNANRFSHEGIRLAGFLNAVGDTAKGIGAAGLINASWFSKSTLELAGLMNVSAEARENVQVAGLINLTAKGSSKCQVAGLLNATPYLKGIQIGFLNFSDTCSGIPIGFLSFVKKGKHQLEVSTDELFYANVAFRTGVNSFYNILGAGIQPLSTKNLWQFTYGVGSSVKLKNKWWFDLSATASHVSAGSFNLSTSELYKFYVGVEYRFSNKMALAAGPCYNLFYTDALAADYSSTYSQIVPYSFQERNYASGYNLKSWFGAKISLRFL